MPMNKGIPVILPSGERFKAKFVAEGSVYQFDCIYIDKSHTPLPVWLTSLPTNMISIQQRDYVRIDVALNIHLQLPPDSENGSKLEMSTITKDVSGGGTLIVSKEPIPLGRQVFVSLDIPEFGTLSVTGEVVRLDQPQTDQKVFWVGIKFLNITEKQRNAIIKYVFKVQLERRKKGF